MQVLPHWTISKEKNNGGAPGSVERRAMELILQAKGWSDDDFTRFEELSRSHSQDTMAFCQGTVEAMITVGVNPDHLIQRLLDINDDAIDRLVDSSPSYWKTNIKPDCYLGQEKN